MNIERFEKVLREGIEKFRASGGVLISGDYERIKEDGTVCRCALSAAFDTGDGGEAQEKAAEVLGCPVSDVGQFVTGFDTNLASTELEQLGAKLSKELEPVDADEEAPEPESFEVEFEDPE